MDKKWIIKKSNVQEIIKFVNELDSDTLKVIDEVYSYPNFVRKTETSLATLNCIDSENGLVQAFIIFDNTLERYLESDIDLWDMIQKNCGYEYTTKNSLLIDFFHCKKTIQEGKLDQEQQSQIFVYFCQYIFKNLTHIENLIFYVPEDIQQDIEMNKLLQNNILFQDYQNFKVVKQTSLMKQLIIRKAKEQDQDNLSLICDSQTEVKTSIFGDYFLSEMISSESTDKVCLVAENIDKQVKGILVANKDINYQLLLDNFELDNYKYFTKSNVYDKKKLSDQVQQDLNAFRAKQKVKKQNDIYNYYFNLHSKTYSILQLQQYCVDNKEQIENEFKTYLEDKDKQKTLNKSVLTRKFEKIFKNHQIQKPNDIFKQFLTIEIETCVMTPLDLLFETLQYFDLDANYLNGEGHWDIWFERKMKKLSEENKQKGLLGKRKYKSKKKREKENQQITKPTWFDIEPFYISLTNFIFSDAQNRQEICKLFNENKKEIMELFVSDNYELIKERVVDFDALYEFFDQKLEISLSPQLQKIIPQVLICFGGLVYDELIIEIQEKNKNPQLQNYTKTKKIKKVSFQELYDAIEMINKINDFYIQNDNYLELIEKQYNDQEQAKIYEILNFYNTKTGENIQNIEEMQNLNFKQLQENQKDAICINLFFMDQEYENSSHLFLEKVFQYFPDKDFLIFTQPYKCPQIPLLNNFTLAKQKFKSNFSQCLYFFHKINLLTKNVTIQKKHHCQQQNSLQKSDYLFEINLQLGKNKKTIGKVVCNKDYNMQYLKENYQINTYVLPESYKRNEVLLLKNFQLNPLFKRQQNLILQEILRLTDSKLILKRFDNSKLKELSNKFQKIKYQDIKRIRSDKCKQHIKFEICNIKSLTFSRIKINYRIFITGGSKAAMGFLDSLLSDQTYEFSNIYLITTNLNLLDQFVDTNINEQMNLKTSFKYILRNINVLFCSLYTINRKNKSIQYRSTDKKVYISKYDVLLICNSLEEKTLNQLLSIKNDEESKKIAKNIFIPITQINNNLKSCTNEISDRALNQSKNKYSLKSRCDAFFQAKQVSFEQEQQFLKEIQQKATQPFIDQKNNILWRNILLQQKNWFAQCIQSRNPKNIAFYGFSKELFVCLENLISKWKIDPSKILIIIPKKLDFTQYSKEKCNKEQLEEDEQDTEYPMAFKNQSLWNFYSQKLKDKGITILENHEIVDYNNQEISLQNNNIEPPEVNTKNQKMQNLVKQESQESNIVYLGDFFVILANQFNIQDEIFNTIQENGLVYNGRLIVQSNFKTIDDNIFATGRICEFSQRYKNFFLGRSLRMDKFDQVEVGQKCAKKFLQVISGNEDPQEIPKFENCVGFKTKFYPEFFYINIAFPHLGKIDENKLLKFEIDDRLNSDESYFAFGFDKEDMLREILYFGKQDLQYDSLKNLMGMHRNYFNRMFERIKNGIIDNFIDYLDKPWSEIIFYPQFNNFRNLLNKLIEMKNINVRELRNKEIKDWPNEITQIFENSTVEFIDQHKHHFLNYYTEFAKNQQIFQYLIQIILFLKSMFSNVIIKLKS